MDFHVIKVHLVHEDSMLHIMSTRAHQNAASTENAWETNVCVLVDGEVSTVKLNCARTTAHTVWDKEPVTQLVLHFFLQANTL